MFRIFFVWLSVASTGDQYPIIEHHHDATTPRCKPPTLPQMLQPSRIQRGRVFLVPLYSLYAGFTLTSVNWPSTWNPGDGEMRPCRATGQTYKGSKSYPMNPRKIKSKPKQLFIPCEGSFTRESTRQVRCAKSRRLPKKAPASGEKPA
ncbi:hypothetical protein DSO57_1025390 [Entomophthora muscae]|uniref:Uncharacterized protein n=1 Tax=Entomophthora muscae TaxID=34485 RepID=A0ACC2S448_9FUNG|nr:hypothetical protein DSO57_1025390 [Entomophthora muscae]